jgi:hypothetical protein
VVLIYNYKLLDDNEKAVAMLSMQKYKPKENEMNNYSFQVNVFCRTTNDLGLKYHQGRWEDTRISGSFYSHDLIFKKSQENWNTCDFIFLISVYTACFLLKKKKRKKKKLESLINDMFSFSLIFTVLITYLC